MDTHQGRADYRRSHQIRIRIGARRAAFQPLTARRASDHAQCRGPVFYPPGARGRRPGTLHEPGVTVDRRCNQRDQLRQVPHDPGDGLPLRATDAMFSPVVVEQIVALRIEEREVTVAALSRVVHRPLGHEGGNPLTPGEVHLAERLEEVGLVRGSDRIGRFESRFPDTGTGLAVQAFHRATQCGAIIHQPIEQVCLSRGTQHRVTEVPGRQRRQVPESFLLQGVGRLVEYEKLVLEAHPDIDVQLPGKPQNAPQRGARAQRMVVRIIGTHEFADEVGDTLILEPALGLAQQSVRCIRKSGVPAGKGRVVIQLVVDVPAEHAVAEPTAFLHHGSELFEADVLASNHTIEVGKAQLYTAHATIVIVLELRRQRVGHGQVFLASSCPLKLWITLWITHGQSAPRQRIREPHGIDQNLGRCEFILKFQLDAISS